ncbi:MAG: DNA/RNA nuclease SfsA [Candidatus Marinimicrobia bacterium]|nr:DNA/RNA nuclease SfsA [Candidatus Neomarinimicrobiota bacterium]MCF7828690.1 DNA/RNA nuclease SfsA [Candidatus Neomarinimicrobiota bacterium]MCF7880431.1 DNA/RNA nuclease SfsA [Candidatus Neomarinimicrobiota bacterium]
MSSDSKAGTVDFPFGYELEPGQFIKRPNRFLAHVLVNGREVKAHVPDPGRLKELLVPDADVMVRHNPSPTRKTDWTLTLVKKEAVWVCINTTIPNAFVGYLLENRRLPEFNEYPSIKAEVANENSRFDFHLTNGSLEYWLEVKSVSLVHNGVGLFPDAPTKRGTRHLNHLIDLKEQGHSAGVLFMVQRSDAEKFAPNWITDSDFSETLVKAHDAGVEVTVYTSEVSREGISLGSRIDFDLNTKYPLPEM